MTAGNNGTSTPEDDDPFGYLYEDGRAAGAQPPSSGGGYGYPGPTSQRGVPRTSYNQVRAVGERQYGQQAQGQGQQYGQQAQATQPFPQQGQAQGQGPQYGQPNAHYAAPETQPGGAPGRPAPYPGGQGPGGGGRGRGPNTRGLLIGAIAVVAAVGIGIGAAVYFGNSDEKDQASGKDGATAGQGQTQQPKPTEEPTEGEKEPEALPKSDAGLLQLSTGLSAVKDVPGAKSESGTYVPLSTPGASATWTVKVPKAGKYTLSVDYGIPGKDAKADLTVNGKPHGSGINMKNFGGTPDGDWAKGWQSTYSWLSLKEGDNTFVISCPSGCQANLARVSLEAGHRSS
ncbi:carbohydrate-binding protein [Streptomyces sp. NPDC021093]|uniref:carbohydrate-binding protein n=1 Tax=Streptomyces sp. NPDC021093 TaxID=3365112 RepID=UPI0037AF0272